MVEATFTFFKHPAYDKVLGEPNFNILCIFLAKLFEGYVWLVALEEERRSDSKDKMEHIMVFNVCSCICDKLRIFIKAYSCIYLYVCRYHVLKYANNTYICLSILSIYTCIVLSIYLFYTYIALSSHISIFRPYLYLYLYLSI